MVSNASFSPFAQSILLQKYSLKDANGKPTEDWPAIVRRVVHAVIPKSEKETRKELVEIIVARKFIPGGRYLYAAGREYHQVNNCFLYRAEDSREGWADLLRKGAMSSMSGGGIGCEYSKLRPKGSPIRKTGGVSSGPLSLMQMVNEMGRHIMQGGARRAAIWAGLNWDHPDIQEFIHLKDWPQWLIEQKAVDFNRPAPMDMTNISVGLDRNFFEQSDVPQIFYDTCYQMFKKSEPGFSVNYEFPDECLRNACTEITSYDDSDVCNLGSINLARIDGLVDLGRVVELGTIFLLYGTLYSDLPHVEVEATREKNRRLGLGLMGIHEWLLKRGYQYGMVPELEDWLKVYQEQSDRTALKWSDALGISNPIKQRAIAPTGTIGIIGETTTGIEPVFAVAFKRRYLATNGRQWLYQYVVDPTAKRLIEEYGVKEDAIEDSYKLASTMEGFERRVSFQAALQSYVDHGISSTINLPAWGSEVNNPDTVRDRAQVLYRYLPALRGLTCYTDGSRGGQPLTPVKFSTAMQHVGQVFVEAQDICEISKTGGNCG
jgi:ribonucleoside-diphosphate reductase alpha chain